MNSILEKSYYDHFKWENQDLDIKVTFWKPKPEREGDN